MEKKKPELIRLPDAARRMGCTWYLAYSRLLRGDIKGHRDPATGKWLVDASSLPPEAQGADQ